MRVDSPAAVNEVADRIEQALPEELRDLERDVLRRAYLTLAFRQQPAPMQGGRCKRLHGI